jgi:hypothetical protein
VGRKGGGGVGIKGGEREGDCELKCVFQREDEGTFSMVGMREERGDLQKEGMLERMECCMS